MTIDSSYYEEVFATNPAASYVFTFENLGKYVIEVYEIDAAGVRYLVADDLLDITLGGQSNTNTIYEGGTVVFISGHRADAVQVAITRSTPITQLVDYQPYTPFPAETTEFTIDKLTMIAQEQVAGGGSGGGGTPVEGAYVPLAGTDSGRPVYGLVDFTNPLVASRRWQYGVLAGFGINDMALSSLDSDEAGSFWVTMGTVGFQFSGPDGGNLILPQDPTEPLGAVTKQYADSLIGGTGYVPLAGTDPLAPITGPLEFENVGLDINWQFGILEGLGDVMILGAQGANSIASDFYISFGQNSFQFQGSTASMLLPNINYDNAAGLAVVSKDWIENNFVQLGGAGDYVPITGTAPGVPITGPLEMANATLDLDWQFGILEGLGDVLTLAAAGANTQASQFIISMNTVGKFIFDGPAQTLSLPDIDYDLAAGKAAVTKEWIEATFEVIGGGAGGDFIPLAGTGVGAPITGPLVWGGASGISFTQEFNDVADVFQWKLGSTVVMEALLQGGATLSLPNGASFYADGGIIADTAIQSLQNMSALAVAPTLNEHLTRKDYVDGLFGNVVDLSSDQTITGLKTFTNTNVFENATFFTSGNVDFNSNKLTRVGNPTSSDHAMPLSYADARYQPIGSYQPSGSYVTTNTTQTISGTKTFGTSDLRFQGTTTSNFFCGYTGSSTFTVGAGGVAVFADEAAAVLTMIVDAIQAGPSAVTVSVEQPIRDLITLIGTPRP